MEKPLKRTDYFDSTKSAYTVANKADVRRIDIVNICGVSGCQPVLFLQPISGRTLAEEGYRATLRDLRYMNELGYLLHSVQGPHSVPASSGQRCAHVIELQDCSGFL
jgi:hypothetical protein